MTPNLIETFKTSIYSPKHTKNNKTPIIFKVLKRIKKNIFFSSETAPFGPPFRPKRLKN